MKKRNSLLFVFCWLMFGSMNAQFISTHTNGLDHNHFSIERLDDHVITGGTVYFPGSLTQTDLHFQRLDGNGSIVWEVTHDIGSSERCLDISMQDDTYILATGYVMYDGNQRAFLMRLDPSNGSLVDYTVLMYDINTVRQEQMGMAVSYAPSVDQYYIVGQAANFMDPFSETFPGTKYPTKNAAGLIICLDNQINAIWTQEVARPATHSGSVMGQNWHLHAFASVIDNPGKGIFISGLEGTANVARLLDYNGATIWNITDSYTGTIVTSHAMCYDASNDRLLLGGRNYGTSGIFEIVDASSGSAFMTRFVDFTDNYYTNSMFLLPTDLELDPSTGQLWMLASSYQWNIPNWQQKEKPCLINIDGGALQPQYAIVPELYGVRHNTMDHDYLNNNLYSSTTNSEKLTLTDKGPVFIGYSRGVTNAYDLNVLFADPFGSVDEDCQEVYFFHAQDEPREARIPSNTPFSLTHDVIPESTSEYVYSHDMGYGCYEPLPCGVTVNSLSRVDYGCYAYTYTANVTPAPGTIIYEYDWTFGDGSSATTTVPTVNYDYGLNPNCFNTVCVTVKAQGSDGSLCEQTLCDLFISYNNGTCPGCNSKRGDDGFEGQDVVEELSVRANGNQVFVTGFDQAYDLTVMDMNGRIVQTMNQQDATQVGLQALPSGIFLIQVMDNAGQVTTSKVLIP